MTARDVEQVLEAAQIPAVGQRAVKAAVPRAADRTAACAKQTDAEADRAMAWLTEAGRAGWKDAAHLAKDRDLDARRGRKDFQKLLAELKTSPAVTKAVAPGMKRVDELGDYPGPAPEAGSFPQPSPADCPLVADRRWRFFVCGEASGLPILHGFLG
jgi:hypothetical protein